jgi:two-component system, OmpR family, sensor histidine kinase KdpD
VTRLRGQPGRIALDALTVVASVAAATGLVAALDTVAPRAGLGVLYLLAVLFVAIRRGLAAALATALLSVVALNFFFIEPRYELTVSHSQNVVELGVLLVAAVVVGRLAAALRAREVEAQERADLAVARESEARMLGAAAASVLEGRGLDSQLRRIEESVASVSRAGIRLELSHVPNPRESESATRLPSGARPGWLYVRDDAGWTLDDRRRIADALARIIEVTLERERVAALAAEAEATRQADVAKTALLHAISHDLRSPLTAITTAVGGLAGERLDDADRAELVSVISTEASRLAHLVDDLLDLSRVEAGAVNPRPDWCELHDLAANAVRDVRSRRGEHPIELDLPADLPLVRGDPAQLERALANLVENAVKYSPAGVAVRIAAAVSAERVSLRVLDEGPGVRQRDRLRIFEPFVRGSDAAAGSGLGLAIARGFVEANGGTLTVRPRQEGGSAFVLSLPLVPQPVPA